MCIETPCKRKEMIKMRYRFETSQMGIFSKKSIFSRKLPEKSFRGHADFIFGIEPSKCVETPCRKR
jgi:hypothetical protein